MPKPRGLKNVHVGRRRWRAVLPHCLCCLLTTPSALATEPGGDPVPRQDEDSAERAPRRTSASDTEAHRFQLGLGGSLYSPDFSREAGGAYDFHGHFRVAESPFLSGIRYERVRAAGHYEQCVAEICPENLGSVLAEVELHPFDLFDVHRIDPWVGAGIGPSWESGDFSDGPDERKGTDVGLGIEGTLGVDVDLYYVALGVLGRSEKYGGRTLTGVAARLQARF